MKLLADLILNGAETMKNVGEHKKEFRQSRKKQR